MYHSFFKYSERKGLMSGDGICYNHRDMDDWLSYRNVDFHHKPREEWDSDDEDDSIGHHCVNSICRIFIEHPNFAKLNLEPPYICYFSIYVPKNYY
jgi:hypothetical protein